jgi:peptidoglycan hydrolase-like protein with peptidoglycan-binding domain
MAKKIAGSVGYSGRNMAANVMTVQYLLNCVPAHRGGPTVELAVDGIVGPKTIGAIRRFQTMNFGRADGRVDPDGRTLRTLHGYDPYPEQSIQTAGAFKSQAGGSSSGLPFKSPGGGGAPAPHGGSPFGSPGQPFGKQPTPPTSPTSPFGKQPGGGGFGGGKWGG